jgi:hypothetical protein
MKPQFWQSVLQPSRFRRASLRPLFRRVTLRRIFAMFAVSCVFVVGLVVGLEGQANSQSNVYERTFPQSKARVEEALRNLQASLAGRLPVLDGFAKPGRSLDRYQRGYYQGSVQVSSTATGTLVRVSMKVTAWYNDPVASHSGYQLLPSNGRLEGDLLDQLADQLTSAQDRGEGSPAVASDSQLSTRPADAAAAGPPASDSSSSRATASEPDISAPALRFPEADQTFSASVSHGLAERTMAAEASASAGTSPPAVPKGTGAQQAEIESLEEVLKNQAHPKNLVAVKKSGTPVVETNSLTAKTLFLASLHDEFELLNFNADWVHVRISGLSRGWIWRNSVEMPDGIPDTEATAPTAETPAANLFHIVREETAEFPGDWEPLRGKNVKILTVQMIDDSAKEASPKERLEYTKFLFEKTYPEVSQKSSGLAGIVVIFDSADGGMIGTTIAALQQWLAGTLSDSALWHQSFFDPPETFVSTGSSASRQY